MTDITPPPAPRTAGPVEIALAWGVHLYTALGLVVALLAILAIQGRHADSAFTLFVVALFIDGTDGTLARAVRVWEVVPRFDGRKLDDITDYINYVLVPCYFAVEFGLVRTENLWALALPLLASGYGFCMDHAKTDDGFFTGFPSYWNIAVFYMYLLRSPPWFNEGFMVVLAVLVFVPLKYLYPTKSKPLKALTLPLSGLWFLSVLLLLRQIERPSPELLYGSLAYPVYYFGLSFYLHVSGYHRNAAAAVGAGGT